MIMKKIILYMIILVCIFFIYTQYKKSLRTEQKPTSPQSTKQDISMVESSLDLESDYLLDLAGTSLVWTGSSSVKTHTGTIAISSVSIFKNNDLISGNVVIDMETLVGDSGDRLDTHLKSEDFFAVEQYPTASLSFHEVSLGMFEGTLTIRDISMPISFTADRVESFDNMLVLNTRIEFNRTHYGIDYRSSGIVGIVKDTIIDDTVTLDVVLSLLEKTA
jgi:polyisoprenoid-binding protein YceI